MNSPTPQIALPAIGLAALMMLSIKLSAQKITPTFGQVPDDEIALKAPQNDQDAEAVIIFDIGKSRFVSEGAAGFTIICHRMKRVKVFKRAGARHAEISIPFYRENLDNTEKISDIAAQTYNVENGKVIFRKLDASTVFEQQVNERWWVKKFAIADVKEGTVFEFRYTFESPFFFNLPDWKFQDEIPTLYSEYSVGMNPFYEYDFIAQGMTKFDYQNSEPEFPKKSYGQVRYNDMVTTFVLKNVPALADEQFITSKEDIVMKVDFQLSKVNRADGTYKLYRTTWPDMCKSLLAHPNFGKYLNASRRVAKDILEEPELQGFDGEKKYQAIINYIRTKFRWNERAGTYTEKSPKEVFAQKTGSATELNMILIATLSEAGADVQPVLLSTRDHGKVHVEYPFEHFFNYVIAFVNGPQPYLTDGTEILLAHNRIPIRCMNGQGLIVSKDAENWVSLEPTFLSHEEINIKLSIDAANGSAIASTTIQSSEYEAYSYRLRFANDTTKIRTYYKDRHDMDVKSVKSLNFDMSSRPYVVMASGSVPIEVVGTKLAVQPALAFAMKENPLKQNKRSYPVDMIYPQSSSVRSVVVLPSGYKVEAMPQPISIDNELINISLTCNQAGAELAFAGKYVFKKNEYSPQEYGQLKNYFSMIVRGFNTPIVLEKQ